MNRYVVFGYVDSEDGQPLFWSNEDGWVSLESATVFTEEEKESNSTPDGGVLLVPPTAQEAVWVQLPEVTK